ncbi:Putative TM nitroreductase [Pseudovibrio denitrificans]|uniref:Putative TM nitroreductase n=1 Tax=Pseudovibrio denitrificans TaxID=258256 RepID=A0A1I7B825_9HYPH|nr:nitroreductase family protein [Pseudovibrio denitrificans]SFT83301.1 Putative TM nitroreductase [Pseudovibrio denitrificans]
MSETPPQEKRTPNEAWFEARWWWRVKMWLQWTSWLQYLPNLVVVLLLLVLAGFGALIGCWPLVLVDLPLVLAALLFLNLIFDVVTVRYGYHTEQPLPTSLEHLDAFEVMRARVSCRSFQKRLMSEEHRQMVLSLAEQNSRPENCLSPSPIRFEYVDNPLVVWPAVGTREFLVAIAPREYHEMAVVDVGRSLQKVVIEATRQGLATCWIGPGADHKSIIKHLGARFDPEKDHIICVCAFGYRSRYIPLAIRLILKTQRHRLDVQELFYADTGFAKPLNTNARPYREFGRCYEVCQWSPSSYNAQPTRAVVLAESAKIQRVDFCAATHSRYYAMVALGIWLANWECGCEALGKVGRFEQLAPEMRGKEPFPDLPRYIISWVPEEAS